MSIFSVQNTSQTNSPDSLAALLQISSPDSSTITDPTSVLSGSTSGSDSVDISKPGQLFSKLQSLATSDPAKFKQVTADFAAKLKAEAASIGGQQGQFLSNLADKFSQTGDVSALKPQAPSGSGVQAAYSASSTDALSQAISGSSKHHHGHHHGGGSSSGSGSTSSSSTSSTNPVAELFQQLDQELSATSN